MQTSEIGNDRFYRAILILLSDSGDVRGRVCKAMKLLDAIPSKELEEIPELLQRLQILRADTKQKGALRCGEKILRDAYEHTASHRKNKTYEKYALEIFHLWNSTRPPGQCQGGRHACGAGR